MTSMSKAEAYPSAGSDAAPRILLVGDHPGLLELGRTRLVAAGFLVETAENACAAVSILKREAIDAVVCDVSMADVDGFESCRRLAAEPERPAIPVILVGAHERHPSAAELA